MQYLHDDSLHKSEDGWRKNLGAGARAIPYVTILVWLVKVFCPPQIEKEVETEPVEENFLTRNESFIQNLI